MDDGYHTPGDGYISTGYITESVEKALNWFMWIISMPWAWLNFHSDITSLRRAKHKSIKKGVNTVLAIQRHRNVFLTFLFTVFSFGGEEEFYLLTFPILFWNVDHTLARRLVMVVNSGLLIGNLYKDVFQLPRPSFYNKKVWMPGVLKKMDSTNCRDFGFPSTHAMNAFSNSLFMLYYLYGGSCSYVPSCPLGLAILFVIIWQFCITFGRMYLGAHTPPDIYAGITLGLLVSAFWCVLAPLWEYFIMRSGITIILVSFIWLSYIHPQPRPATPTFLLNTTNMGCMSGCIHGTILWFYGSHTFGLPILASDNVEKDKHGSRHWLGDVLIRMAIGYTVLGLLRLVIKAVLIRIAKVFGADAKKGAGKGDSNDKTYKQGYPSNKDLTAAWAVKLATYHTLAVGICYGIPVLFSLIGISKPAATLEFNPNLVSG